jgi:hypothetical protein
MERESFAGAQILVKLWYKSENCLNAQSDHGFFEGNAVLAGFSFLFSFPAGITPSPLATG